MKERAFNARPDEVRAILAGATVLRRMLRVQPDFSQVWYPPLRSRRIRGYFSETHFQRSVVADFAPWKPGDHLWIRETWAPVPTPGGYGCAPDACEREAMRIYRADGDRPDLRKWSDGSPRWDGRWRSASAMPRWASRLVLEVAGVEVEKGPEGWFWVVNFRRADG